MKILTSLCLEILLLGAAALLFAKARYWWRRGKWAHHETARAASSFPSLAPIGGEGQGEGAHQHRQ